MGVNMKATLIWVIASMLLLGIVVGYFAFPNTEKVITKEVIKEVPVNVTKEVIKEVPSDKMLLDLAVKDFMKEVNDDDDLLVCDGYEYDFDEISISRVYDDYSIMHEDEDYTLDFNIKLKYDEDSERSCRNNFEVSVFYEEDEDPQVSIR